MIQARTSNEAAGREIIIWGASGHALVVADIIRLRNDFRIVGFLDNVSPDRAETAFADSTVLGGEEQLQTLRERGVVHAIIAFGNCAARLRLGEMVRDSGFLLERAVHPTAVVAQSAVIGAGTVVAAGAVINPEASVGQGVIVNTGASVDHECFVDDGAHLAPGVRLAGRVRIGRATVLGIGAVVADRVHIGNGSVIGAGAVVLEDVPPGVVAYGAPARVIRKVEGAG